MPRRRRERRPFLQRLLDKLSDYDVIPNPNYVNESDPLITWRVYLFQCECQDENFSHWESAFRTAQIGEICDANGCQRLVMPYETLDGDTKYQGDERVFGEYQCHKCERSWSSGNSWANTFQECEVCNIMVYPNEQYPRQRKMHKNYAEKGHQEDLCGKCIEIRLGNHRNHDAAAALNCLGLEISPP